jgi:hypothetical protein
MMMDHHCPCKFPRSAFGTSALTASSGKEGINQCVGSHMIHVIKHRSDLHPTGRITQPPILSPLHVSNSDLAIPVY